jgi:hypothetical protein
MTTLKRAGGAMCGERLLRANQKSPFARARVGIAAAQSRHFLNNIFEKTAYFAPQVLR